MKTTMYLLRHAAAEAKQPNPPLIGLGIKQAELTRDFLAVRPIDFCYSSPKARAAQTASIIAASHGLTPQLIESLSEWDAAGESFAELEARVTATLESLLKRHAGQAILVVAHHDVNRVFLASLLGMNHQQTRQVQLDNCGISVIVRDGLDTTVNTLNASFHLQGIAA